MNIEIISRNDNKVVANIVANLINCNYEDVREEIIIGDVGIYLRIYSPGQRPFFVHIMFENLGNDRDKIYSCTLCSEVLKIVNQKCYCDDSQWRILYSHEQHFDDNCLEFDLTLEVDDVKIIKNNPFALLYDDTDLLDFKLCADDGSVQFHSTVLATASPVLRRMLNGQWTETRSRSLQLQETSKQTIQQLKDYIYLNNLPNIGIEHLPLLASYYMMTELEEKCIKKIVKNATSENVIALMQFALKNKLLHLYDDLLKLVKRGTVLIDKSILEQEFGFCID